MASVSTKLDTITTTSAVSEVMTLIVERLERDQREKLAQWMKLIEDHAERIMQELTHAKIKRRKLEIVAAAAIYDSFLEYESRTGVKLNLPMMNTALGRTTCIINTTWIRLFDNRVSLKGNELDVVDIEKDSSVTDAITRVMQALADAVDNLTPEVQCWLDKILLEAIELAELSRGKLDEYDVLVVAASAIYTATQTHHGKMMIRITQKDLSLLSATSPAMISKCWLDLFGN